MGHASQLKDPVYAATKFFAALVKVPGYQSMPVYRAAQAVQHSADGTAYGQYEQVAGMLSAAFTGGCVPGRLVLVHALGQPPGAVRRGDEPARPHVRAAGPPRQHSESCGRACHHRDCGARPDRACSAPADGLGRRVLVGGARQDLRRQGRSVTPDTSGARPAASGAGGTTPVRQPLVSSSAERANQEPADLARYSGLFISFYEKLASRGADSAWIVPRRCGKGARLRAQTPPARGDTRYTPAVGRGVPWTRCRGMAPDERGVGSDLHHRAALRRCS